MTVISREISETSINLASDTLSSGALPYDIAQSLLPRFFNEMSLDSGDIRQSYHNFFHWLNIACQWQI